MTQTALLWQPSPERIAAANMTAFAARVSAATGRPMPDYAALWRWSIDERRRSGARCGTSAAIVGERGARTLVDGDRMPGARWFPDARLNFAENLLRARATTRDGTGVPRRGPGQRAHEPRASCTRRCRALAAGAARRGRAAGDRVAGLPAEHARGVVAMLAAAAVGAIWSSCSPDFGVAGRARPLRPDRAQGALRGRRLLLRRQADRLPASRSPRSPRRLPSRASAWSSCPTSRHAADARRRSARAVQLGRLPRAASRRRPIEFAQLPFDHPLYILYSSGTTGVPKCIVHGAGGTLLQHLKEHRAAHATSSRGDRLFYFTTCGWMMWNWLVVGPRLRRHAAALRRLPVPPGRQRPVRLGRRRAA